MPNLYNRIAQQLTFESLYFSWLCCLTVPLHTQDVAEAREELRTLGVISD